LKARSVYPNRSGLPSPLLRSLCINMSSILP